MQNCLIAGIHDVARCWTSLHLCSRKMGLFSCSTQLSRTFHLLIKTKIPANEEVSCCKSLMLINVKMPTIVGILTFMSRINFVLS